MYVRCANILIMQGMVGAGCMTYNFTSSAPEGTLAVQDGNGLLSSASTGAALPYSVCGATNCSQPRTISLDADLGVYYLNMTGSPTVTSWAALSYTLYGANHKGVHACLMVMSTATQGSGECF